MKNLGTRQQKSNKYLGVKQSGIINSLGQKSHSFSGLQNIMMPNQGLQSNRQNGERISSIINTNSSPQMSLQYTPMGLKQRASSPSISEKLEKRRK